MKALTIAAVCILTGAALSIGLLNAQSNGSRTPVTAAQYEQWKKDLSNWGRWGKDDQIGALNLITPAKVQEAAKLAQRVGLRQRFLHTPDRQHLMVVAGELGLVGDAGSLVGLGGLTLDCAHCQGFSGPFRVFRVVAGVGGVKSAKIYQEPPAPGNF